MQSSRPGTRIDRRLHLRAGSFHLRIFGLALMLLSFCVFAWGLKYKLSLYDPPHAISHHMPAAKLLPGPKRSAAIAADLREGREPVTPIALFTTVFGVLLLAVTTPLAGAAGRPSGLPEPHLSPQRSG